MSIWLTCSIAFTDAGVTLMDARPAIHSPILEWQRSPPQSCRLPRTSFPSRSSIRNGYTPGGGNDLQWQWCGSEVGRQLGTGFGFAALAKHLIQDQQ